MASSKVALLGTLRELHAALPDYDWRRLEELVVAKQPDLLCVEIDRQAWEGDNMEQAPVESHEVLARLCRSGEVTLIPIGGGGRGWAESGVALPHRGVLASLRRSFSTLLDRATVSLMKLAGGPRAINSPIVEHACGALCELQVALADREGRQAWRAKNEELLDGIIWILRRDPGRRVLIALDCRRKHWLRRQLRSVPEATLVDFWSF